MFDHLALDIPYQRLQLDSPAQITVKRLDAIHPHISGNKFFKLKYNLLAAKQRGIQQILSFGGAYSNHIAAIAYAAHYFGFKSIGVIRGEELRSKPLNATLKAAKEFGMQLCFVDRQEYQLRHHQDYLHQLAQHYPNTMIIPEGGTNDLAIQGCREILSAQDLHDYDVICCPVGTGGTIAGIIEASATHQQVLGFSALKGNFLQAAIRQWTQRNNWLVTDQYSLGGYAKTTPELVKFIQQFELEHSIPLDPIYTAKMMLGLLDLVQQNYFVKNCRILAIHTGGLQGRQTILKTN